MARKRKSSATDRIRVFPDSIKDIRSRARRRIGGFSQGHVIRDVLAKAKLWEEEYGLVLE